MRGARLRLTGVAAAVALLAPGMASADNGVGGWSSLAKWPVIPIHAVMLGDGRVVTYGTSVTGTQTGHLTYDIWDPRAGLGTTAHLTLPNTVATDLFCNAQLVLPTTGELFMAGGDVWNGQRTTNRGNADTVLLDPVANTLSQGPSMSRPRFYATLTTLPNGDTYIQGGKDGEDLPELRDTSGGFHPLAGIDTTSLYWWYPRHWVAPDGRIFGLSDRTMYYVDPYANDGNGSLVNAGTTPEDGPRGTSSSEAMFAPGRILRVGGGGLNNQATADGISAAAIIDINGAAPAVTPAAPMPVGLHWHTATVVADGRVVVTGGSFKSNQLVGVNTRALIWDPATGGWTQGVPSKSGRSRLYHSSAILLADGSVLVGGGGARGPEKNLNAEKYFPPYLYTPDGSFAVRPKITAAPTNLTLGQEFGITVNPAWTIKRVTLIKTGSVTHSFNMEQRFLELPFRRSGKNLLITAPSSHMLAPPGKYLLFVINADGVPSVARVVGL